MPELPGRRCVIAVALVVEIVIFSIVTFVIAYLSSNSAIHHASQQLADSMADTVALRVAAAMLQNERAPQVLADDALRSRAQSRMLPADTVELPARSPDHWSVEWMHELRTLMMQSNLTTQTYVMAFHDMSTAAVATYPWFPGGMIEFIGSAYDAERRGYRVVDIALRYAATMQEMPDPLQYMPLFAGGRDNRTRHAEGYFAVVELIGKVAQRCIWVQPLFNVETQNFLHMTVCTVFNASGTFLGLAQMIRDIQEVSHFLSQAATTPNTQIFIVDSSEFLVAATTTQWPTGSIVQDEIAAGFGQRCSSSMYMSNVSTKNLTKVVTGCRAAIDTYPYQPLQDLWRANSDFVLTLGRRSVYQYLDGDNYYVVSVRVTDPAFLMYSMNLVLFLPESDVIGDVRQGIVLSIGICVALCIVGALLSTFLVMTLVRRPSPTRKLSKRRSGRGSLSDLSLRDFQTIYNEGIVGHRANSRPPQSSDRSSEREGSATDTMTQSSSGGADVPVDDVVALLCRTIEHRAIGLAEFATCVAQHGGSCANARRGIPPLAVLVWGSGASSPVKSRDDRLIRALLCGLALQRSGAISTAVVAKVRVPRYTGDVAQTILRRTDWAHGVLTDPDYVEVGVLISDVESPALPSWLIRASDAPSALIRVVGVDPDALAEFHANNDPMLRKRVWFADDPSAAPWRSLPVLLRAAATAVAAATVNSMHELSETTVP